MSFQVDKGLAKFDFNDYHAILGIPLGSSPAEIRKRYLKIAKSLHPDSREEATNKKLATQLLSKLVNPAYEVFSQEKQRTEYEILLRYMGQRVVAEQNTLAVESSLAQQLRTAPEPESFYAQAVKELAEQQYQVLDQVMQITGQLSELNMIYLLRRESGGLSKPTQTVPPSNPATPLKVATVPTASQATNPGPVGMPAKENYVSQYYRRAEELVEKNRLQQAIMELRDALKLEPQNSRCHSLLGTVYFRLDQYTMAKVHFNQALKFDPKDVQAIQGKEKIAKIEQKNQKGKAGQATPPKAGNSGLFGLFGGKKK